MNEIRRPAVTNQPQPKLTETEEFKRAVAAEASKALAELLSKVPELNKSSSPAVPADEMMSKLAMAIAELTDQGTGRKRIDPEEAIKRRQAHERMGELILKARSEGKKPQYQVLNKVYLNERFIEPFRRGPEGKPIPTVITWTGVPNEYMMPMDPIARGISEAFKESIGSVVEGPQQSKKPLWMTSAGLVVQGDPPQSLKVGNNEDGRPTTRRFEEDLGVPIAIDPSAEFVNILGTVAAPARQNNADLRS